MALEAFNRSVFKTYFDFDDAELESWTQNVLTKLRQKGIVAEFIERDFDEPDENFDALYEPIVKFFGYLVRLAREFEEFKSNEFLANQYLQGKGIFTCGDETLDELAYSITNLLRVRSRRGTIKSIQPAQNIGEANGEILNLLCWDELTIFILGNAQAKYNGLNVDNCSPLYRGTTGRYDLNVGYEFTEDVVSLDPYPLINSGYIGIQKYNGKTCIHIQNTSVNDVSGIGLIDLDKKIVINPNLDYEITFEIAQDITYENISFGVKCFDFSGNEISTESIITGTDRNYFFQTRRLNKADKFYFVRGIIYNKDQSLLPYSDARLNIGFGESLRFPETAVSIIPYIVMDNNLLDDSDSQEDYYDSDSISIDESDSEDINSDSESFSSYDGFPSIYLWNIKVTPSALDYERCYINNKNFIDIICSNSNGNHDIESIKDILRKYFIPYNTAFNVINLPRIIESSADLDHLLLETGDNILLESDDKIILE